MEARSRWTDSEETGGPFSHCMRCKRQLGRDNEPWLVNKEYRRGECVLEYAICLPCRLSVTDQLSSHSKESVREFVEKEVNGDPSAAKEAAEQNEATVFFEACVSCGRVREDLEGFGISALFDTGGLVFSGPLPLLICQDCTARMTSNISQQSKRVWGKFLGDHLEGPPDGTGFHGMI